MATHEITLVAVLFIVFCGTVLAGEYRIIRSNGYGGDEIESDDFIDCEKFKAKNITAKSCYCGTKATFYTDKNGVSACYKGLGKDQLGCILHVKDPEQVIKFHAMSVRGVLQTEHMVCEEGYEALRVYLWKNEEWIDFPTEMLHLKAKITTITLRNGKKSTETDFIMDRLSPVELKFFEGALIKIDYLVCGRRTCLLVKFSGTRKWFPSDMTSTTATTITKTKTTATTTINTSSKRKPEQTTYAPTTYSKKTVAGKTTEIFTTSFSAPHGKHEADSGLSNKNKVLLISVSVLGVVFLLLLCAVLIICCRTSNDKVIIKHAESFGAPNHEKEAWSQIPLGTPPPSYKSKGTGSTKELIGHPHMFINDFFMVRDNNDKISVKSGIPATKI